MKTLVTGATGYLGIPLVRALVEHGIPVRALIRSEHKGLQIKHPLVELVKGDITDVKSLQRAVPGCKQIFHLAAFAGIWSQDPELYRRINVEGTKNLLSCAIMEDVEKVVLTSTAGVLGPVRTPSNLVTERTVDQATFFSQYDSSKFEAEKLAFSFQEKGLNVVAVNPTRIYGPGLKGQSNSVTHLIELFMRGKWHFIPGNGHSQGNYVYIDDVVMGHLKAMEKGQSGERYVLGGENVSYNEFFDLLKKITGLNPRLHKIPVQLLLAWSYSEVILARLTGKKPMIVPAFVRKLTKNWSLSSKKATEELDYHPTTLENGLRKTVQWLQL